ncbi:MAG: restriction endonuclease subunit S [Methylophilus sp.]
MVNIANLLTEHMDIWTAADTGKKSGRGRASGNVGSVYGVEKLRELILELAVRGKLVPQDPNDEPANKLLKRIQVENAKLIAEGKLKKDKTLAPISEDEKPFEMPSGWEWVRLGDVLVMLNGRAFKPTDWIPMGLPIVRIQNLNNSEASFNYCDENGVHARHIINKGSFLISWSGTPGTSFGAFIWNGSKAALNQHIFSCFQIGNPYFDKFLELAINTRLEELISKAHGGVGLQHVTKGKLEALTLVLPPLLEQHRIVAKVDELMALCDQLEQQHSNAQEAHETLVSQLLATLTQSQNAAEFNANWQRIYAHFDVLFTTEASIDGLKQTLLQLAVMGKLVPQDLNDEPASELLKRIQAEKAKLIAEGKLKKEKPLAPISEDEKPFGLPKGWEWERLSTVSTMKGGFAFPSSSFGEHGDYQVLKMGNIKPGQIRLKDKPAFVDEATAKLAIEAKLDLNDIVITMTGTVGKRDYVYSARVTDIDINGGALFINQRLCAVKPYIASSVFLDKAMKNDRLMDEIFASATGTANQANISMAALANWLLPIPPIAEQHRIVDKVDALMALCDQLKTRIQQANQQQQAIADALVAQAVA